MTSAQTLDARGASQPTLRDGQSAPRVPWTPEQRRAYNKAWGAIMGPGMGAIITAAIREADARK